MAPRADSVDGWKRGIEGADPSTHRRRRSGYPSTVLYRATCDIAAAPESVWAVLVDFASYPEWNPFTPRVVLDGALAPGTTVALHTRLRGRIVVQKETVRRVMAPRELVWGVRFPVGAIRAERVQRLEPRDGGCRYVTEDRIEGPLSAVVERLYGASLREGFGALAEALAKRCE